MSKKRILFSLGTLVAVAAVVAGGTIAFYNDTETSTGNIFVAGSVDLRVDHLKQTYNDMNCETCSLEIFSSDGQNYVTDSSDNASYQGPFPKAVELVADPHNNWVDHDPLSYKWVWVEDATSANDAGNIDVEYTFERDFQWNGVPGDILFEMALASDNGYAIYVNDDLLVDNLADEVNYNATIQPLNGLETQFKDALELGNNTLKIVVRNHAQSGGTPSSNPGGLLYRLSIENEACEDDLGFQQVCRLWSEKDLEEGDTFFTFGDIKPGDEGMNLISLHVYDNDSWACLVAHDGVDDENVVYEPEGDDDDSEGEVQDYIEFFAWLDDNDGEYESGSEEALTDLGGVALGDLGSIASLDSLNDLYLTGTTTAYVGLAWCAGDIDASSGSVVCDGSGMLNDAQSDSFTASLTAYAEQVRNNGDFSCANVDLGDEGGNEGPETVSVEDLETSDKVAAYLSGDWFFYNDTNDTIMSINQFNGNGGVNDIVAGPDAVGAAQMTLHSDPANPRYNIATYRYNDVKLSDISSLKYRIYDADPSSQTPFFHFNVDFDNSDTWQSRLVHVPTGVSEDVWTTVDAINGGTALWTYSGANWPAGLVDASEPGTNARTWDEILANYPNAETRSTDSFLGVRVGHPGPVGETGYVDWIEFDGQVSDFEN